MKESLIGLFVFYAPVLFVIAIGVVSYLLFLEREEQELTAGLLSVLSVIVYLWMTEKTWNRPELGILVYIIALAAFGIGASIIMAGSRLVLSVLWFFKNLKDKEEERERARKERAQRRRGM